MKRWVNGRATWVSMPEPETYMAFIARLNTTLSDAKTRRVKRAFLQIMMEVLFVKNLQNEAKMEPMAIEDLHAYLFEEDGGDLVTRVACKIDGGDEAVAFLRGAPPGPRGAAKPLKGSMSMTFT